MPGTQTRGTTPPRRGAPQPLTGAAARRGAARRWLARPRRSRRGLARIAGVVTVGWVVLALALGFIMDTAFSDKALPGFTLAGRDISGMTAEKLGAALDQVQSDIAVTVNLGGVTQRGTAADLGITVDRVATMNEVWAKADRPFWLYRTWGRTVIPLTVATDADTFNAWLRANFPDQTTPAVDAGIAYDPKTHLFTATPAKPGTGITDAGLAALAAQLAGGDVQASIDLTPGPVPARVTDAQAAQAQAEANKSLGVKCELTTGGKTAYTLTADDIASFLRPVAGREGGLTIDFDLAAIGQFIDKTLTPRLNAKPVTQLELTDAAGKTASVVVPGSEGRTLKSTDTLATNIAACLTAGQDAQLPLDFATQAFTVKQTPLVAPPAGSSGEHWADVNITLQTVTLMNGTTPGKTFRISSGSPIHPTPRGTFHAYSKVDVQPMRGCDAGECWEYYNVRWVVWFYKDFGFHTAYWHNDFGTPVSHGCINLREADAKVVYDWLSIGDAVVVHD